MGLDQFLMREVSHGEDVVEIYWRKSNQVHGFFDRACDGVENCQRYPIEMSQLKKLRDICKRVLDNHSLAEELLPTVRGFFFGCYDYDEYYFDQLEYTVEEIDKLLEKDDNGKYYYISWW